MKVNIKFFGPIRREIGSKTIAVDVPPESSVGYVIHDMAKRYGKRVRRLIMNSDGISGNLIILLNRKEIGRLDGWNTPVNEGDTITILPHIQGGSAIPVDIKYYLETYGCALNTADSDLIAGHLNRLGAKRVSDPELADIMIVNTCGVKEPTEDRIIYRLSELAELSLPVVVAGCLPKISLNRVRRAIPNFGAIVGPQCITTLPEILNRILRGERGIEHLSSDSESKLQYFEGPPQSVICTIPIAEGCIGECAYCAVKFAREELNSYPISEIMDIAKRCVHLGYKEIRLTGQDTGVYGFDTSETLPQLLSALDEIQGTHRFRLGMFNPNAVKGYLPDLLDTMTSSHFFQFFHIPIQSGSNDILRLMRRRYVVEDWVKVIESIRNRFPMATIATDIIVGFPGESDKDFDKTMELIKETRPTLVNISKYGDRPGTLASKSDQKTDTTVKKNRSRKLSKYVNRLTASINKDWVGWEGQAIVTEKGSTGGMMARNFSYKPIILKSEIPIGTKLDVRIISATKSHLLSERTSRVS
ncbi:tRNA (N(6)-L-threonylcarbamoyladenosine(37)-C(2))-methylthiotransferase [Candidatus Thorarchaeota archaeon]|nr:MAG: tRNA (N(6)-L-threonylcarbamoyladenosine(37)-C(2))-methylthiotransferase [Candidatus Thorarchaeota archaeon]